MLNLGGGGEPTICNEHAGVEVFRAREIWNLESAGGKFSRILQLHYISKPSEHNMKHRQLDQDLKQHRTLNSKAPKLEEQLEDLKQIRIHRSFQRDDHSIRHSCILEAHLGRFEIDLKQKFQGINPNNFAALQFERDRCHLILSWLDFEEKQQRTKRKTKWFDEILKNDFRIGFFCKEMSVLGWKRFPRVVLTPSFDTRSLSQSQILATEVFKMQPKNEKRCSFFGAQRLCYSSKSLRKSAMCLQVTSIQISILHFYEAINEHPKLSDCRGKKKFPFLRHVCVGFPKIWFLHSESWSS